MSTAQEPKSRWAFFAHHMLTFVIIGVGLYALADLTGNLAIGLAASAFLLAFMAGEYATKKHTGLFCDRCMDRMPTDGTAEATRRDWALRLAHWTWAYEGRIALALIAIWLADISFGAGIAGYILWPWWGVQAWAWALHSRLSPWCRYCRKDDDGDDEDTEVPTPDPAAVRSA